MRPFAFALAVFWSLQVLVCLAPEATAEGNGAAHSHAPGPHHHPGSDGDQQDSDDGCAQHCASLSQTIAARPATVSAPVVAGVAIAPIPASGEFLGVSVGAIAWLELGRQPPDLLARNATLRI